MTADSVLHP